MLSQTNFAAALIRRRDALDMSFLQTTHLPSRQALPRMPGIAPWCAPQACGLGTIEEEDPSKDPREASDLLWSLAIIVASSRKQEGASRDVARVRGKGMFRAALRGRVSVC